MAGARKGMIDRSLQTSIPGAFAKELLNVTVNHVISIADCKTTRGVEIPVDDSDILDRYLARGIKDVARRNSIVTAYVIKKARKNNVKTLLVRSPLTCEAEQGVCQRCYGLSDNGRPPEIGTNVGVEAGQSMAEPATQMVMRSFHTGGAAGMAGGIVSGFTRISDLLKMPKILKNKATLSRESGKITMIDTSPIGGWNVWVDDEEHHVPAGRRVLVKQGQTVSMGDRLSDGPIKPQELLELRNMRETQDYIVNSLKDEYLNQGIQMRRRVLETVVRPLTNSARVTHPGGHEAYVPGDHAPLTILDAYNRKAKPEDKIEYEPIIRGINTAPLASQDWITRLNFQRLKETLIEGPAQGWKSDIATIGAPLAAYAYGPLIGREREKAAEDTAQLEEIGSVSE
jgi:DNA-directed RNA polymerase subunit beta'